MIIAVIWHHWQDRPDLTEPIVPIKRRLFGLTNKLHGQTLPALVDLNKVTMLYFHQIPYSPNVITRYKMLKILKIDRNLAELNKLFGRTVALNNAALVSFVRCPVIAVCVCKKCNSFLSKSVRVHDLVPVDPTHFIGLIDGCNAVKNHDLYTAKSTVMGFS